MNVVSDSDVESSQFTIKTAEGEEYAFTGLKLGFGTSRRTSHLHHPDHPPRPGTRCSGCRWTNTTIYWSTTDDKYLVHIVGRSVLEGERDKIRTVWAEDPDSVLDGLLISPPRHVDGGSLELPQPNAHALEEAAERDRELARVLKDWYDEDR